MDFWNQGDGMKQVVTGAVTNRGGARKTINDLVRFAVLPALLILLVAGTMPERGEAGVAATAPVYEGVEFVAPLDGKVRNGDLVEFYAFWDSTHYAITANFNALDNGATSLVTGVYKEEKGAYWFAHSVSDENSRTDDGTVSIRLAATNPLSDTQSSTSAIQLCLSNNPPVPISAEVIGDSTRFVQKGSNLIYQAINGEVLTIETVWEYELDDFSISADFSLVDAADSLHLASYWGVSENGLANYQIQYRISDNAVADGVHATNRHISIKGYDGGCGIDSLTVTIDVDNKGPSYAPFLHTMPDTLSSESLAIRGGASASAFEGVYDVLAVVNNDREFVFDVSPSADSLIFEGEIGLDYGANFISFHTRDLVENRSPATTQEIWVPLNLAPVFRNTYIVEPDTAAVLPEEDIDHPNRYAIKVRDGDYLRFYTYWDDLEIYSVWADMTQIDSNGPSHLAGSFVASVIDESQNTYNCYAFEYTMSSPGENTVSDYKNIPVPITAFNANTGGETTTESLRFCLCNNPPQHIRTWVINDPAIWTYYPEIGDTTWVMRNGGPFSIYTSWFTLDTGPAISIDFSGADRSWDQALEGQLVDTNRISELSTETVRTYRMDYRFGESAVRDEDPKIGLPIRITLNDQNDGCNDDTAILLIEMDNDAPASSPLLSSDKPNKTTDSTLVISGTVDLDVVDVLVKVVYSPDSSRAAVLPIVDQAFSGISPPLIPGENQITVYARDEVGNRSHSYERFTTFLVTDDTVVIPKPYRSGDKIEINSIIEWSRLEVTIFNLEGDEIDSWSYSGFSTEHGISLQWDGTNQHGDLVHTGPYLLRIQAKDASGNTQKEEVKAFVFTR
jgi:hypothetical protein